GLRPLGRGRLLGPGQPPGLGHVRERPARHGLAGLQRRLVRPYGAAQPRHPPLCPGALGRGPRGLRERSGSPRIGRGRVVTRRLRDWDAVVVGLGALGSAAAWALARAGVSGLGLGQFELGHARGASPAHARIIRRSYHTPGYVRLAGLAYRAWAQLEEEAGEGLLVRSGGLDLFPAGAAIPPGPYRASLEACGVPYRWLDAAEVMRRWPAFRLDAHVHGLWQADGGIVPGRPRHPADAPPGRPSRRHPAGQHPGDGRPRPGRLGRGDHGRGHLPGRLLLCADAWTGDLLAQLGAELPLVVTPGQFSYFRPAAPA